MRGVESCFHSGFSGGDTHGRGLIILGTSNDPLAAKLEVGAKSARDFVYHSYNNCSRENKKDVSHVRSVPA
jgi:hypothetical protein